MPYTNYADFARTKGAKDLEPRKRRGEALREKGSQALERARDYINPKRVTLRESLSAKLSTEKNKSDRRKKGAMIGAGIAAGGAATGLAARYGNDFLKRESLKRNMPFETAQSYRKTSNLLKRDIKKGVSAARSGANKIGAVIKGNPRKIGGGILGAGLTAAGVLAYLKNRKKGE